MLKLLSQSNPARLTSSPNSSIIFAISQISAVQKESKRFARSTKPYDNGPHNLVSKGIISYEYRRARGRKVIKLDLPDMEKYRNSLKTGMTPEEIRSSYKEKGIVPHRQWLEMPITITNSNTVLHDFVPPLGDGKSSLLSKEAAKEKMSSVMAKGKHLNALRKLRNFIPEFDPAEFADQAFEIYKKTNMALSNRDMDALPSLVTEMLLPDLVFNADLKTIKWNLIKSLEPPRVVSVRIEKTLGDVNFSQVIVRFHTQQTLAVYDRFGRLVHGNESIVKDVLEYIVFENQVSSNYGTWRVHAKILPQETPKIYSPITSIKPKGKESLEDVNTA